MGERTSSKHPFGSRCTDGDLDHHEWQPVSFRFETQLLDDEGRVQVRQPDIEKAHVYFICMKCRGWTYGVFDWVGYYLGDPADVRGDADVIASRSGEQPPPVPPGSAG